jgi:hypothetical protein
MLLKLIKYEIKSCYAKFVVMFSLYIFVAAILLINFGHTDYIIQPFFVIAIIALSVITVLTIFQRYSSNLFNSEGYLMFTLPCDGKTLLLSKLLAGLIWIGALFVIVMPSVLLAYSLSANKNLIKQIDKAVNYNHLLLGLIIVVYLAEIVLSTLVIYFSISVSKLAIWRRFRVLAGLATYFIIDLLSGVLVYFITGNYRNLSSANSSDFQLFTVKSAIIQGAYDIALCVLIFYAIAYLLDRKISLK